MEKAAHTRASVSRSLSKGSSCNSIAVTVLSGTARASATEMAAGLRWSETSAGVLWLAVALSSQGAGCGSVVPVSVRRSVTRSTISSMANCCRVAWLGKECWMAPVDSPHSAATARTVAPSRPSRLAMAHTASAMASRRARSSMILGMVASLGAVAKLHQLWQRGFHSNTNVI